jgi:hypothetical protein
MIFKKSSSKVEREIPLGGVTRKSREKFLMVELLGFGRGFKILPRNGTKMLFHNL